jgi:hypothetical protein
LVCKRAPDREVTRPLLGIGAECDPD